MRLFLFGFLPAGEHHITLTRIDRSENLIESKEKGRLAQVRNHTIRFHPLENGKLHYIDAVEIKAGLRRLEERVPTFAFTLEGWHPRAVAEPG